MKSWIIFILGLFLVMSCTDRLPPPKTPDTLGLRTIANSMGYELDEIHYEVVELCKGHAEVQPCPKMIQAFNTATALQHAAEDAIDATEITGQGYDQARQLIEAAHEALIVCKEYLP